MASSRIEELPDDSNENTKGQQSLPQNPTAASNDSMPSLEAMLAASSPFGTAPDTTSLNSAVPGATMPPGMSSVRQHTADELLSLMNKVPLFMTDLPASEEGSEENVELEALKALAYEGTRAEIASNFRTQGNEMAQSRRWKDAREYYDRAAAALRMDNQQLRKAKGLEQGDGDTGMDLEGSRVVDEEEEHEKERNLHEVVLVNRALCNLEMKNYGTCNRDCASVLKLNPRNVKAWYRSASACFALDKLDQADDACSRGLEVDPKNTSLTTLASRIQKRQQYIATLERERREREDRRRNEDATLALALRSRNIVTRTTKQAPEMEDAKMSLEASLDAASTLILPVLFLYPVHMQSDLVKAFREDESVGQHLSYVLSERLPWDEKGLYTPESVECYAETIQGGLVKVGKKMALLRVLNSGKVEVVDGLLRVNVVPKQSVGQWIEEFKKVRGKK